MNFNELYHHLNLVKMDQPQTSICMTDSYSTVLSNNSIDRESIEKLEMSIETIVREGKISYPS
jgi:hypothetical protein